MTRTIEISRHETKHDIAVEYATVFDNGLVQLRRKVEHKLNGNESDLPNASLTADKIKWLAAKLEEIA